MAYRGCKYCGQELKKGQDRYCKVCKPYFDAHPNKTTIFGGVIVDKK